MDFKALSRTAEADVRAFASAARQRLVWHQVASVGLAESYRLGSFCCLAPRAVGSQAQARGLSSLLHQPVSPITCPLQRGRRHRVCRQAGISWISEGVKRSRLGKMSDERTQEGFALPNSLNGDQRPWLPDRTAHPDRSQPQNPCDPACFQPRPTAAEPDGSQPRLPTHAIPPATGNPAQR